MLDSTQKAKQKSLNPITEAIKSWWGTLPSEPLGCSDLILDRLLVNAPKRWTVYVPMVLLPSGSLGAEWDPILQPKPTSKLVDAHTANLWRLILNNISKKEGKGTLTHLAINSAIPAYESAPLGSEKTENILRSPSGLISIYGDFGPSLSTSAKPSQQDFENALWVKTKQNGIIQIWAPRYTMFSRGNIKEKARLLGFHENGSMSKDDLRKATAVDLYAGIGYFVFSYVKSGIGRVIGWELNPWSVEGLRRGAVANGWSIKILGNSERVDLGNERIIVFGEDNRMAGGNLRGLDSTSNVIHVNCGFLPTSSASWKTALEILTMDGWLHLHENVAVKDVNSRRLEIESSFERWLSKSEGKAKVIHVEFVKTFAPAVWHCVFDVHVSRSSGTA